MKDRIKGAALPPPERATTYAVKRPQKHGPLDLTILDDTVFGVNTHYVVSDEGGYKGTHLCTQYEPTGCPIHDEKEEWAGFLPCWDHDSCKRVVLRLAPREYEALARALGIDLDWAGKRLRIRPTNDGTGRGIAVAPVTTSEKASRAQSFDVTLSLCSLFGVSRIPRQQPADEPTKEGGAW